MIHLLALLIGVIAGLRTMTAFAATSWAARLGGLSLGGTWLGWMAHAVTPWVATVLALGEFITDQLPGTPSRKVPVQFAARLVVGGVCGAAIGSRAGSMLVGAILGVVGAVIGTLGGAAARASLARAFHKDPPAAFIEDAVAIGLAAVVIIALRA